MSDAPTSSHPRPRPGGRTWWKPLLLLGAVLVLFILALTLDWDDKLQQARGWIESLGPWGPIAFILLYIAATVAAIPGTALTLAAGPLFGPWLGTLYVSIGATLGATLCFLISRYFARDAIGAWLEDKQAFQRLDEMTERHGGWMVAVTRLIPFFPFNILNYGFGLTRVRLLTYICFTWLCMLPGTAAYVFLSDQLAHFLTTGEASWLLLGSGIAILLLLIATAWWFKRKYDAADHAAHP